MTKIIYIAEFERQDSPIESIWFVGQANWQYKEQLKEARKRIASEWELDEEDMKDGGMVVTGIYTIPQEMVKEVYESK